MDSCVKLPLDDKTLEDIVEKTKDYALMHGICMRRKDAFDRDALHFAPFLLFPSPFPKQEFQRALEIQPLLNEMMHKLAHDHEFLVSTLKNTIEVDKFTGKLFEIYEKVHKEGFTQTLSLGMFRSDYFFCCLSRMIKQVEFNTIASSFGSLTSLLVPQFKYVLSELGRRDLLENIPENHALEGLARAMIKAWKIYDEKKSVVMFIVEDVTYNICDQKFHEFEIRKQNPDVLVIRKTLTEVAEQGSLTEDKRLVVDGQEVAVIYFRCGYHPDQYPTEREWDARLMMERSLAIKSPSIHYHLAGTKKVQQQLAVEGSLERFISDKDKIHKIRDIFTGLYSLDHDAKGNEAFEMAIANPSKFVLKPQREGGGNNVYGDDIKPFLNKIKDSPERNAYILMDRIAPPITTNYMVRPGMKAALQDCISELGIFGYVIGDSNQILENEQVGHMLRTKLSHVNEGGVAAGLGALDSVFLVDVQRCCPEGDCENTDCCASVVEIVS